MLKLQVVINDGVEMMLEMSEKAELAGMTIATTKLVGEIIPGAELAGGGWREEECWWGNSPCKMRRRR